jgi:prolyl 3-hydroxylase /prolyl 3,4-dihydroxylase
MIRRFAEAEVAELSRQFRNAKPFPHAVLRNVLDDSGKARAGLRKEPFTLKDTDLFTFKQTSNLYYARTDAVKRIVAGLSSPGFAQLIGRISGKKLRAGAVDVFGALYEQGDYLLCHDDQLEGRTIAFILYLSDDFSAADGGALALHSSKGKHPSAVVQRLYPEANSLVFFEVSARSWHEVEEVLSSRKRYSIGGWLH